ncbi:MAG: DUF1566 domain-containing protein [Cryomorphaceae bacterium]|nr:DUF1566 domain-containing protein [Cryomorphaceae bacterium]
MSSLVLALSFGMLGCSKDDDSDNGGDNGNGGNGGGATMEVSSLVPQQVQRNSFRMRGRVANGAGVLSRGFAWGSSSNPTVDDNDVPVAGTEDGTFNVDLSGLDESTLYHYRAYVRTNSGYVYGNNRTVETLGPPAVGEMGPGGLIIWLDGSGGGLVAAPESTEWTNVQWGCGGTLVNASAQNEGQGSANTTAILNGCSEADIAAALCNELVYDGYEDWFLPSRNELGRMYINLKDKNLGGLSSEFYWSSTEVDDNAAIFADFNNGGLSSGDKSNSFRVRAVRAF